MGVTEVKQYDIHIIFKLFSPNFLSVYNSV